MMHREHKELLNDIWNIAIGFTPVWWVISVSRFVHKWGYKRKGIRRTVRHLRYRKVKSRKNRPISQREMDEMLR